MSILPPGCRINLPGHSLSHRYASNLLEQLGASVISTGNTRKEHPAERWANSGLMYLTGNQDGPPLLAPVPLPGCADGALNALRALTGKEILPTVEGAHLLTERAAISGHHRNGPRSGAGHCRLLATLDACIGLSLARADDWTLLPAWLGTEGPGQHPGTGSGTEDDWEAVALKVKAQHSQALVERGRLLGLAVVDAQGIPLQPGSWMNLSTLPGGRSSQRTASSSPRVLDLSSLWAGPLCSHLWQEAGAEVIKVEGTRRPDGARSGSPEFFDLLNGGKQQVTLDLHRTSGQRELRALIQQVDIVLEGSRPRALRQMGIVAEEIVREHPGLSWVSITGHGRGEPEANWIAYGDDAGVAAGLSALLHEVSGHWLLCGDAIADPLTGLHAALAGWASWLSGGGHRVDLSLAQTVRYCITATAPSQGSYQNRYRRWMQHLESRQIEPQAPQRRSGGRHQHPD